MSSRGALILAGLFVVAFALLGLGQCGYDRIKTLQTLENAEADVAGEYPSVDGMSGRNLAMHREAGQRVILIDARSQDEFEVSHLEGAVHFPDFEDLLSYLKGRSEAVDLIVTYGSLGYRSSKLAQQLTEAGIEDVANLRGGIFRWANEGGAMVGLNGESTPWVHPSNKHWAHLLKKEHRYVAEPDS